MQNTNPITATLSRKSNPCRSIWNEARDGKITKDELIDAVYMHALKSHFKDYQIKPKPIAPAELVMKMQQHYEECKHVKGQDRTAKEAAFSKIQREKHPNYYNSLDVWKAISASNFNFLCEMSDYYKTKNPMYHQKIELSVTDYLSEGFKRPAKTVAEWKGEILYQERSEEIDHQT